MSEPHVERTEARLRAAAGAFAYPPTPDVAGAVKARLGSMAGRPSASRTRLAWAVVGAAILFAGLLTVPEVRAGLAEVLRIGVVRIFLGPPTATLPPATPGETPSSAPTPRPSPTPLSSALDLAGETTLADARFRAGFPIRLPSHPADLGPPDRVFLQELGAPAVILVWLDAERPGKVRLSLQLLGAGSFSVAKFQPQAVQQAAVHGQPAIWAEGPYLLQTRGGDYDVLRLIAGRVLIWQEGEITYRLETDLPLEQAVKIAESLK